MFFFFFFNDTATTEIYTLSLHDALPILPMTTTNLPTCLASSAPGTGSPRRPACFPGRRCATRDRKSTRLNSSHGYISYAVFCLNKKQRAAQHSQLTSAAEY